MEDIDLKSLLEGLREHVDDLEIALAPLLRTNHSEILSKLPLLDKAKLSVLTLYAIESILFSVLSLNGVNAKEHAVFSELSRVKQYFAKVKEAESGGIQEKPNAKLDGAAANRFIKHALAGNDRFDRDRAERQTTEKANAEAKVEEPRSAPKKTAIGKDMSKKRKRSSALQQKDDASQSEDTTRPSAHPDQQLRTTVIGSLDSFQNNVVPRERKQTKKAKRERDKTETNDSSGQKPEKKSSKPPKDSKAALNDLLNRQGAANSKD